MAKKGNKAAANGTHSETTTQQATPTPEKRLPVEVRLGRLRASIWRNRRSEDGGLWLNVTLSRSYKQGEEWKSSTSFGMEDLLALSEILRMTFHRAVEVFREDRQPVIEAPKEVTDETVPECPF